MTTPIWQQTLTNSANEGTRIFTKIRIHRLLLHSFAMAGFLCAAASVYAQPLPSRMQCSPVTPETKVPFIEVAQLPNVARDPMYYTWCTDLDNAWTPQSYPDPKYVPKRTPANEARVNLLLRGLKDYVAAESDDWVSYVNAWLGSTLPPPRIERLKRPDGSSSLYSNSDATDHMLKKFETGSKILSAVGIQSISPQGTVISNQKKLYIFGLGTENLCITPVDLQKAFENQPGYLFRPMTVRTSQTRPNLEELAKLGGQWFGYEVYAFGDPVTKQEPGLMSFGFSFEPCAASISINVIKKNFQGDKK